MDADRQEIVLLKANQMDTYLYEMQYSSLCAATNLAEHLKAVVTAGKYGYDPSMCKMAIDICNAIPAAERFEDNASIEGDQEPH